MRRGLMSLLAMLAGLAMLSGCAAVTSLSGASVPLDAYALRPLAGPGSGGGTRHLVVEAPTASGAIATERILVQPSALQAAYLPGARWVDPAPALVQTLLVQSLQASGGFRLVGRTTSGLLPDQTLLTEITAFQAELGPEGGPTYVVRVALSLSLVRDADGRILGSRSFEGRAAAGSAEPLALAAAFDVAMGAVLRAAVPWVAGAGGGV